jgi:hypothetical protein
MVKNLEEEDWWRILYVLGLRIGFKFPAPFALA